jgi:hypothetical protein
MGVAGRIMALPFYPTVAGAAADDAPIAVNWPAGVPRWARLVISSLLLHLAAHPSPSAGAGHLTRAARPSRTAHSTSNSSGDLTGFAAALAGAGAAIVGAFVGGWLTMLAGRQQSRNERKADRLERSKQAALDIASAWPVLEEALLDRSVGKVSAEDLNKAFNAYSRTAGVQSIPIVGEELRRRIRGHLQLAFSSTLYVDNPEQLATKVQRLRSSRVAMSDSIEAYYNDKPLPPSSVEYREQA